MKHAWLSVFVLASNLVASETLRPPAVPLVACDPYFSVWSPADNLNDADTVHWTGKPHRLSSLVKIDGQSFRLMGAEPKEMPALKQTKVTVLPTRTIYEFEGAGVALTLTFLTPALPDDLEVLSWPVTYVTYESHGTDGKTHTVEVRFAASGELAVNDPAKQEVEWSQEKFGELSAWKVGSKEQPVLQKKGDDIRIDWGYLYVATDGSLAAEQGSVSWKLTTPGSCRAILAYDDLYSIRYMRKNLRPYWRRNGWEAADLLKAAARDYESLAKRCAAFDKELMADLTKAGGAKYATICALAYRQCFAAGKFVADANGQPISFCKENHSNGCIGTSDVFYPMAPQFLLFGPTLAKSFLVPFMNYAASERWKFPFAPHDLGQYPHANGQRYGGGERTEHNQMPVEESGNLLILMAAIAQMEGNANFAGLYWKQLEQWAEYLKAKGFDPENQLCTDDFAGHLAHNVNLSAKAICGLGAFGKLCAMRGDKAKAAEYAKLAKEFAARWVKEADDGDHYRLAFDKPGTWSQKYNIVWDRIFGLGLFPAEVSRKEMDYYRKIQNKYGVPLDNRSLYTKLDWILWTATLTQARADFEALVAPVFRFLNETPDRSPMTDWYFTDTAKKRGFTARPVVGGVFMQALYDKALWKKWADRERTHAANWAPIPSVPKFSVVIPTAREQAATWRYTTKPPGKGWFLPGFNDADWKQGQSGFGTPKTPGATVRTEWKSPEIWLRREIELPAGRTDNLMLLVHHDEDIEIHINGFRAARAKGYLTDYEPFEIDGPALASLKPGKNLIAVRCQQTGGGQYIDVGFVSVK
ncbi:MAG: DUF4965 domain-containing protein [Verrucomicrobia bacterium]|nr:DUF4965 domain-containing protein [Verrucomicrobiota bacterium]